MSAKMGRPTNNPKNERITVRLDRDSKEILEKYCQKYTVEKAEAVRRGIGHLRSELGK